MHLHPASYKFHLSLINKKSNKALNFIVGTFGLAVLTLGFFSAYLYWDNTTQAPLRAENAYLEKLAADFQKTKTQLSEVQDTFRVAGAKIKVVDSLKEATAASRGFWSSLDDIEKIAHNLDSMGQILKTELENRQKVPAPAKFENLNIQLAAFYTTAAITLEKAYQEQLFTRDITVAISSDFYLTPISDESLWQVGRKPELIAYYEGKKSQANTSLSSLAKLTPPEDFKTYLETQSAYLTLLVETSDKITRILQEEDSPDPEQPTQIEKAYQMLTLAKVEHEKLANRLLSEKLRVFDVKRNYERFAQVKLIQNSLEAKITEAITNQPVPAQILPKFLQALQIPPII